MKSKFIKARGENGSTLHLLYIRKNLSNFFDPPELDEHDYIVLNTLVEQELLRRRKVETEQKILDKLLFNSDVLKPNLSRYLKLDIEDE